MSDSETPSTQFKLDEAIVYRPFAFDSPANPMGNKMAADFGNPKFDSRVFQIDSSYQRFIDNYDVVRRSGQFESYVAEDGLHDDVREAVSQFVANTVAVEYPEYFRLRANAGGYLFENKLLGETVQFDEAFRYAKGGRFAYRNGIDALTAQIPEDLAIVQVDGDQDRLSAVHVVAPSGWNPAAKLGGSFVEVHHPVEHHRDWIAKVQAGVRNMAKSDQPLQRFGWGINYYEDLNLHPDYGVACGEGRKIDDADLFVRVERQVLQGFPEVSALLFTIRIYVERCAELPVGDRKALQSAIEAMGPGERAYKGVQDKFVQILRRLS